MTDPRAKVKIAHVSQTPVRAARFFIVSPAAVPSLLYRILLHKFSDNDSIEINLFLIAKHLPKNKHSIDRALASCPQFVSDFDNRFADKKYRMNDKNMAAQIPGLSPP